MEALHVDDNDEDDAHFQADLARAIAASKANESPATSIATLSSDSEKGIDLGSTPPPAVTTHSSSTFLAERAQLERARLARLKRLRGDSDLDGTGKPPKRRTPSRSTSSSPGSYGDPNGKGKEKVDQEAEIFWDGELRQTANMHAEPGRNGEDGTPVFRLSEIIGDKSQIELAIISTYALQLSWIYKFFAPSTPVILVTQPAPSENGNTTIKEALPNWIRVTPFLRGGRGVMHMKFFLLFYRTGRLRVVVSTANLMDHDWRDIENTVWVQDVPRRPLPISHEPRADDFPSTLERVLYAVNVAPAITSLVSTGHPDIPLSALRAGALRTRWDFSRVRPTLVPSIAGKHEGWPAVLKSGHMALMHAVSRLNPQQRAVSLECQGSSIGAYSAAWLTEFLLSARGASPEASLNAPKSRRAATPMPVSDALKILFPTRDWVRSSVLGEAGGGTIFCRKSTWEAAKFPRNLFCESRSRRGRVLMHSKMIIATFVGTASPTGKDPDSDADSDVVEVRKDQCDTAGYAYVGSHNFTPSAWGTLSGSAFTPVLNVTNYELGIVFPLKDEVDANRVVCYERPPRQYGSRDRPWMQEESEVLNME
ncbi:tyrosyl-DNA phosphodiesterase-domain-containing protein [Multifurca ochricompacta]|uniref:Tyrosyl-DNA phosphodiesterase-domain-containing protein n=1 Tax=Multifurca ochricompacta TaxID=376703 RepID=A0AAD4LU71_9AGAM|nr:tyrosyl-DNA phosphodiesterase-domain-containing protein [Multifurca ochricompacta]